MSEAKRVSLQSAGPVKKEKKSKPTLPSIRLNLTLPPRDGDTYADFNYKTLILNEKKKEKIREKDEGKVNGFGPLDPYASDDEDNLKEIARSFESKYGTPKKKYHRLEDYSELGTGYDENDSFIDNADAFDEAVPEDQTTERGGFYVNKGKLVLKRVDGLSSSDSSDSDSSDSPRKSLKQKLESDSESGSSDSSGDSSDSDESEDSEDEDDNDNEAAEIDTEESPHNAKENKTNGHTDVIVKKPKLSDFVKCAKFSSKKAKNKAITGLFLKKAVREKEHNENRQKLDIEGEAKRVSNVDAAIEAVARGEDSKESGIAESKSHSDLSDSYDSEESQGSLNGSGQPNGLKHPLPDNLPEKVKLIVCSLKAKAAENRSMTKQEFFNNKDVNTLLLRFEKNVRHVPASKRGLVYEHLQCFLPCSKEYLMKKGFSLLRDAVEAAVKEPLSKLKEGINLLMPNAMERYRTVCQRLKNQRSVEPHKETTEIVKSSPEKTKIPRRRFPWTEELKVLLCSAVRKRRIYFHVTKKNKDDKWEDHLREFFKKDVIPMWEAGWMKITSLMDIVARISPDLLQATPNTPEVKLKKSSGPAAGGRKIGGVAKQISYSVAAVGTAASVQPQPPTLSPAPIISQTAPADPTPTPTPPPPPLSAVSPISSPASSPSLPVCEAEPPIKKSKPNLPTSELHVQRSGDGLLDLSNFESGGKKTYPHSSGQSSVPTSVVHTPNHNSVKGIPIDAIMGNKLSSLSSSVSLTVKPVHSNDTDSATHDLTSKKRNSQGSTVSSSKSSNINNGLEMDVLNLKSQNCSDALSSPEYSSKKRLAAHHSGSLSVKTIQNSSSKPSFSSQSLETQKSQPSNIILNSGLVNSSQAYSSQPQQLPNPNPIKVSSVAAINLKLSSQAQTQSTQSSSQPMKTPNLPDGSSTTSNKPSVSSFNTPSVISHSMESNNPSLTITPVKPFQQGKVGLLSSSSSMHNSAVPVSSQASSSSRSERTEVIVTPSSSMPHIKTTSVPTNLQSHRPDSAISYTSSNLNLPNVTVKAHKPNRSQSEVQVINSRIEKKVFSSSHKSQERDKNYYGSPSLWPSSAPSDSAGVASTSVKTTTSSEKVMVSRKDRILQESRDRGVIDSSMPTLSGPYRSSSTHDTSGNLRPHAMRRTSASQNHVWDDELFVFEEFLSTSPKPVHSPKVSSASMDSYKQPLQVSELQRCDSVKAPYASYETQRTKPVTISPSSESQRVNVVMQAPISHSKDFKSSSLTNSQSHDHLKSIPSLARVTSATSSCILDTTRANVVMTTSTIQEPKRVNSLKDEMNDILASIPSQLISRTDHYTITNSMHSHHSKRSSMLPNVSDIDDAAAVERKDDALQTAQELSTRGTLMSRTNCDVNFSEDGWVPSIKKTAFMKSTSEMSDHRLSGMSGLSMSGLDGIGGMSLGLPPHLVGYQNEYQRHLYGSTSKSGQSDHRPS